MTENDIPVVAPELMFEASTAAAENRAVDPMIAVVGACSGKYEPEMILATLQRLTALANLIQAKHGTDWTIEIEGEGYTLLHESLLRAAARAPLLIEQDQKMGEVMFDPAAFLQIALAESTAEGSA